MDSVCDNNVKSNLRDSCVTVTKGVTGGRAVCDPLCALRIPSVKGREIENGDGGKGYRLKNRARTLDLGTRQMGVRRQRKVFARAPLPPPQRPTTTGWAGIAGRCSTLQ